MKKYLMSLLLIIFCLSLCSCSKEVNSTIVSSSTVESNDVSNTSSIVDSINSENTIEAVIKRYPDALYIIPDCFDPTHYLIYYNNYFIDFYNIPNMQNEHWLTPVSYYKTESVYFTTYTFKAINGDTCTINVDSKYRPLVSDIISIIEL